MKRSEIVMKTDALMFIVLSGAILAVSVILLTIGATIVPPIGITFAFFAAFASLFGLLINAINLVRLCRGNDSLTMGKIKCL